MWSDNEGVTIQGKHTLSLYLKDSNATVINVYIIMFAPPGEMGNHIEVVVKNYPEMENKLK